MTLLACEGIAKRFGDTQALAGIDLGFEQPATVGLVGPNGAGKTTLINILAGLLEPDKGMVFVDGKRVRRVPRGMDGGLIVARTFQETRLIMDAAVLDNILLGCRSQRGMNTVRSILGIRTEPRESKDIAYCRELLAAIVPGVGALEYAGNISYGQQKLLGLACCIATEAHILLLDEPLAGLDPTYRGRTIDLIRTLRAQGKLVIFIEHDLQAVRAMADSVIVLGEGAIIAQGAPLVLDSSEVLEAYLG